MYGILSAAMKITAATTVSTAVTAAMGFVKFAAQEKYLFRWLYLDGKQFGTYQDDVLLSEIMTEYGYTEEIAQKLHQDMTYYSYGLAILANTGHLNLTDEELLVSFRREFTALAAYYGVSPIPVKFRKHGKREIHLK